MLLSKRSEMFLPGKWPSYFSSTKGCYVTDLDNNEYLDMSIMGIGTNTLGYSHPEVDEAVKSAISSGNMASLNCPEEVFLAEKLLELHPWAGGVKFARSGGEANAIAIRIARAAAEKSVVAFCGYHGWHDWYLAANLADRNQLDQHLLPGLSPAGVPEHLSGSAIPFEYDNIDQLEEILTTNEVGVVKMEVIRSRPASPGYLKRVRELCTQKGIILVFDECTSGFRQSYGGIHLNEGVEPDLAVFGKALGNGYAITAIVGRNEIMSHAQSTFISSTFWTERIGPTAALKSLQVMHDLKSWEKITETGRLIKTRWEELFHQFDLRATTFGIPAICGFNFDSESAAKYKTYITQEMLKQGILAANLVYVCTEHKGGELERYFYALEPMLERIKQFEEGADIDKALEGDVCHTGFKRLN